MADESGRTISDADRKRAKRAKMADESGRTISDADRKRAKRAKDDYKPSEKSQEDVIKKLLAQFGSKIRQTDRVKLRKYIGKSPEPELKKGGAVKRKKGGTVKRSRGGTAKKK